MISIINEKISLYLCKRADLVFAVNNSTRQLLIDAGHNAEHLFVVGNGLDHEAIDGVDATKKNMRLVFVVD